MTLYLTNPSPEFNITRTSHVVLTSKNLDATRHFYEAGIGLQVTHQDDNSLYFRALEETSHHSLVFVKNDGPARCLRMGYRMYTDDDIRRAYDHFNAAGFAAEFVERPFQGLTLHVNAALKWYCDLGFRLTEYTANDNSEDLWGIWLKRKDNTQDVVFGTGPGPRLHHFAYHVPEIANIIHVSDVMSSLGMGDSMDRGPGRHGIGNAMFVYFRDPDGHRVEMFTSHYQFIDSNQAPKRWDLTDTRRSQLWGFPATKRWFTEATEFEGTPVQQPMLDASPVTLEAFLERT